MIDQDLIVRLLSDFESSPSHRHACVSIMTTTLVLIVAVRTTLTIMVFVALKAWTGLMAVNSGKQVMNMNGDASDGDDDEFNGYGDDDGACGEPDGFIR